MAQVTPADYQRFVVSRFRPHLTPERQYADMALGLPGEAGEVTELLLRALDNMMVNAKLSMHAGRAADLMKKRVRDGRDITAELVLELGDVLFYVAAVAHLHNLNLGDIILANIAKLSGAGGQRDALNQADA